MGLVMKARLQTRDVLGRKNSFNVSVMQCDACGDFFGRRFKQRDVTRVCSCGTLECRRALRVKGGATCLKTEKTNIERWGVISTAQHPVVKERARQTCEELYGGPSSMSSSEVRSRLEEVVMLKYGVRNSLQSVDVRELGKQTMLERYGADHPMRSESIKQRVGDTMESRYGVRHALQNEQLLRKARQTYQDRCELNGGDSGIWSSVAELEFIGWLEGLYGPDAVKRQRWFMGHPIDAYIAPIDVWVQFDGEFWHGLDMPLEELQDVRPRAYQKHLSDREQDEQFASAGMRLVRVTDREFKHATRQNDYSDIVRRIERNDAEQSSKHEAA